METIICDISAFQYWRIPPVVRLLTEAPPDDPLLLNLVDDEELERLRAGSVGLPLARACWASGARWRAAAPPPMRSDVWPGGSRRVWTARLTCLSQGARRADAQRSSGHGSGPQVCRKASSGA